MLFMTVHRSGLDPVLAEMIRTQLFNSTTALQRARLLEGLVRVVYDHAKFQTAGGGRLDDQERNGVGLVLASAARYSHLSLQGTAD